MSSSVYEKIHTQRCCCVSICGALRTRVWNGEQFQRTGVRTHPQSACTAGLHSANQGKSYVIPNSFSLCLRLCLQFDTSSERLFKVQCLGAVIMWYFSARHRLHLLEAGWYGAALWTMDHLRWYVSPLFLRVHRCLDNSDEFDIVLFLNDWVWLASLSLKVVLERPMYCLGGEDAVVTVAL
jgi:hypothetical protein